MHAKRKVIVTILLGLMYFALTRCNNSDSVEELSGNYFFRNEGGYMKQILNHNGDNGEIYGEVISYNYNADFIVAKQRPNINDYKEFLIFRLRENKSKYSPSQIDITEHLADSILMNDAIYRDVFTHKINYWIISHKNKLLYGPLTRQEYEEKRRQLGVFITLND